MKILFITSTRLGDAILSTGILEHLYQTLPQGKVTVACGPLPQTIFEGFPNVGCIIALQKQRYHGHWIKLWQETVGTRWDMVIDLRNSAVSRLLYAKKRYVFGKHIDKSKHKVEQIAQTMKLQEPPAPKLYFTKEQQRFAAGLIPDEHRVLAVGPSANWIGKTWPSDKFIEVINWMTGSQGPMENAYVAVFAAPGEESQAQPVLDCVSKERQIDGIAKGNPGEVAAALSRCEFYIGNDSGLMHAAAAAGVKTIGVFGPSYPHLYAPWGKHTSHVRTPETFDELINFEGYHPKKLKDTLMKSLQVQDVIYAIENLLKE